MVEEGGGGGRIDKRWEVGGERGSWRENGIWSEEELRKRMRWEWEPQEEQWKAQNLGNYF